MKEAKFTVLEFEEVLKDYIRMLESSRKRNLVLAIEKNDLDDKYFQLFNQDTEQKLAKTETLLDGLRSEFNLVTDEEEEEENETRRL